MIGAVMEIITTRYRNSSTTENLDAAISVLQPDVLKRFTLFASPNMAQAVPPPDPRNGPDSNFPLVSAIAEFEIPRIVTIRVVFDGVFLTAARLPRYGEVKELLNAVVSCGRGSFSAARAPFTAQLGAEEAFETLCRLPATPLTAETRPAYFSLLSTMNEAEIAAL
jgi:hypothetical protein